MGWCPARYLDATPLVSIEVQNRNLQLSNGAESGYTQEKQFNLPVYHESRTETKPVHWACTVNIAEDSEKKFGANFGPFTSKKEAKAAAAADAVQWLRAQGKLPQAPIKRLKTSGSLPGLIYLDPDVKAEDTASLPQRVHDLVASLGFLQPRWESTSSQTAGGEPGHENGAFHDMAAFFDESAVAKEPRLAGPLGLVEHVYGIKHAKNACCQKVLPLLEEIKFSRKG